MSWLIYSQIASWVVIAGFAAVIIALARQIGVLHERIVPAGALTINAKVKPGMLAPGLSVQTLNGTLVEIGGAAARSRLLFFLSPECPVCKTLLPALKTAARRERAWLETMLLSDGDAVDHRSFITSHQLDDFPYIVSELVGRAFGIGKLPYGVLLDEQGTIVSMGLVNSREHLDSLFEAKREGVATIQDYLARSQSRQAG